jgi:ribosomal protein S27E
MPLIRCENCGKSSFAFARRTYVAHCSACGRPLTGHHDTTSIESEIRERLYGRRSSRVPARPRSVSRAP